MKTLTLVFKKRVQESLDAFNNPVYSTEEIRVDGCLIAPTQEPLDIKEVQAMEQNKIQARVHLPKTFTGDVGNSILEWNGRTWQVDSSSTSFMTENCPTKWNRYFRVEALDE